MKRRLILSAILLALSAGALSAVTIAVWPHRPRNSDFVPSEEASQRAVEAFLSAWQRGEPVRPVPGTKPEIMGADALQAGGRKLEAFTILGPVPADAQR